ncbi:MAG: hypothetical protein ACFE9L_19230 [Candidatus Hodarchaeota archaeon]
MFSTKSDVNNHYAPVLRVCSNCGSKIARPVVPNVTSPSRLENYKQYIQIIGIVEIVFGIFALLIGFVLLLVVPLLNYALQFDIENSVPPELIPELMPFLAVLFGGIAVICFVYAFVSILSGKKMLQYDNSGRIGTMVIAALNLLNFPFGTVFGLAALVVLSRPEVEQLYMKY